MCEEDKWSVYEHALHFYSCLALPARAFCLRTLKAYLDQYCLRPES